MAMAEQLPDPQLVTEAPQSEATLLALALPEKCRSCPVMTEIIGSVNRLTTLPPAEEKAQEVRKNMIDGLCKFGRHVMDTCTEGTEETFGVSTVLRKPQVTRTCQSEVQKKLPNHRKRVTTDL